MRRACGGSDGRAFQAATALIADDATCGSTEKASDDGSLLGAGTSGTGDERCCAEDEEEFPFHDEWSVI